MMYRGWSLEWVSEDDTDLGKEKIYKFEFDEDGLPVGSTDEESDKEELENINDAATRRFYPYVSPDWAEEAINTPLVRVQLPKGVPAFWNIKVGNVEENGLRIKADPCRVFMRRIGRCYRKGLEIA